MGNKQSKRKTVRINTKLKLPKFDQSKIKIASDEKLVKIKKKCKKLGKNKTMSTATKIDLIRKAIPGLAILYEPLKTFYSLDKVIMGSNFGAVSKAYCKKDLDTEVMVKVINLEDVTTRLYLVIQGLVTLTKLDHPNVCKIKSMLFDNDKLYLIMDYENYVSLSDYVLDCQKLTEDDAVTIVHQLLALVKFLNDNKI